jgi:LPS export ABC transporter protein LptC
MNRDRARVFERRPRGGGNGVRHAAAVALALALIPGCGRKSDLGSPPAGGVLPDQIVSDFVLTETEAGALQWKLYAREASTYNARNIVLVRSVRVDFYDEKQQQSSELTAREGEIQLQTHDMTARGNVVLQTTEGTRMSTEEMHFLNREQKIVSPVTQEVRVERAGDTLTGYGFESDPGLRHYEFKRKVRAVWKSHPGDTPLGGRGGGR